MIVAVLDGNGVLRSIVLQAQGTPIDRSGIILFGNGTDVVMPANAARSGWLIQNQSATGSTMLVNEVGGDPMLDGYLLAPGAIFPPPGYPVPVGAITVAGAVNDHYFAREW